MIHDWMGRQVRVSPRTGHQIDGVLSAVDQYGVTLHDTHPTHPLDAAFEWGTVHIPWRNVASTHLLTDTEGDPS